VIATLAASSAAVLAADRVVQTQQGPVRVEVVARGLEHPWAVEFLPDRRMLVTERPGRLRIVSGDGRISQPLAGIPTVLAEGQGGLLDLALDPEFASNRRVYICYAEPGEGGASTAAARGLLGKEGLRGVEVIFRQQPKVEGDKHFGCRIAFSPDRTLFLTLGERFKFDPAQDLSSDLGKIVRINQDGSVPSNNPFVGRGGVRPEIWSYGHRNVQGAAIHPQSGALWISEFGPRGGDEINIPEPGRNYGWPLVSWGKHYSGEDIPDPSTRPDLAQSIYHWTPSISPSGIAFYTGDVFPSWRGNLLVAALTSKALVRLTLDGQRVTDDERIDLEARIRDVVQGPDSAVYVLTDEEDGQILRLTAAGK
jgi:glucose/arabinose dehydrogenase